MSLNPSGPMGSQVDMNSDPLAEYRVIRSTFSPFFSGFTSAVLSDQSLRPSPTP